MRPVEPLTPETAGELGPVIEQWKQAMFVAGTDDETDAQFVGMLAHRPELMKTVLDHYAAFLLGGEVSTRLKELIRISAADAIGCNEYCVNIRLASGRQAGVTEDDIAKVRKVDESDLAPDEKAALRFAREFVRNPRGLTPFFDELRPHFTDSQIVEIGIACATYMGFGNMVVAFGLQAGLDSPLGRRAEPVSA